MDCYACFLTFIIGGLSLGLYEYYGFHREEVERRGRERVCEYEYKYIIGCSDRPDLIEGALKDYEIMNREIQNRGTITQAVGAILITASFLIMVNTPSLMKGNPEYLGYSMGIVSMGLYVSWFFVLNYTTKKLDNITFSRMRAIEEGLKLRFGYNFGIHSYIKNSYRKNKTRDKCWIEIRRRFWYIPLLLLFAGWAFIFAL